MARARADLEKPLGVRSKLVLYPNCPGCTVVQRHLSDDRLPTKELTVVALLVVCNSEHSVLSTPLTRPLHPFMSSVA